MPNLFTATYRVIYGDTDQMGVMYYGNYARVFEMGRTELFRSLGLTYKELEAQGVFLPVAEYTCRYHESAQYDDMLVIETSLDASFRSGMKFKYNLLRQSDGKKLATGHTIHPCVSKDGKVVRPPAFLKQLIEEHFSDDI